MNISLILTNKCFTKRAYFPEGLLFSIYSMAHLMVDMNDPDYVDMKNVIFFKIWVILHFLFPERDGFILNQSASLHGKIFEYFRALC